MILKQLNSPTATELYDPDAKKER